jgi:hypothetical protein
MDAGQLFKKFQIFIAHNVPAVYDVFASPIKETVRFPGLAKMWVELSVGAERPSETEPRAAQRAAKHIQTCYAKWVLLLQFLSSSS